MNGLHEARRAAVPMVSVQTADASALLVEIGQIEDAQACIGWDAVRGLYPLREEDKEHAERMRGSLPPNPMNPEDPTIGNPHAVLDALRALPAGDRHSPGCVLVMLGAQRALADDWTLAQSMANRRDNWAHRALCVILHGAAAAANLPPEIAPHVLALDAPHPTREWLRAKCERMAAAAELTVPPEELDAAADALTGLDPFSAEQAAALAISKSGFDPAKLWANKRSQIERVDGLEIAPPQEDLDHLHGIDGLAELCREIAATPAIVPGCILQLDELEKMTGTHAGDSSKSEQLADLLGALEQRWQARGLLLFGPAGTGKSAASTALGALCRVPTITWSLSRSRGHGLVGQAGHAMAEAMRVIGGVCGDRTPFVVGTANAVQGLDEALRSRFSFGTWFADLPDEAAQAAIWAQYAERYGATGERPRDGIVWTGREIRNCCRDSALLSVTIEQHAARMSHVAKHDAALIESIRSEAERCGYTSCATGRPYARQQQSDNATGRRVR